MSRTTRCIILALLVFASYPHERYPCPLSNPTQPEPSTIRNISTVTWLQRLMHHGTCSTGISGTISSGFYCLCVLTATKIRSQACGRRMMCCCRLRADDVAQGVIVPQLPPKICFQLLKEKDARKKLQDLGLSDVGDKHVRMLLLALE